VLRNGRTVPTFPRAEYLVQRSEWTEAQHPNERTRAVYLPDNWQPVMDTGQLRLLDGDTQLTDRIRCVVHPGHTSAYQSVILEAGGHDAIYVGDLAPFTTHLERIQWLPAYDVLPLANLEAKRQVRDWALESHALLLFQHDSFTSWGYLVCDEEGRYHVVPAPPSDGIP
jgi:glyoxylase-like metal-dependent hydrolase (beta-lactamase superfamily II)